MAKGIRFNVQTKEYEEYDLPEKTAEELAQEFALAKEAKKAELDAACAEAIAGGVPYDGHMFPSTESDMLLLIAAEKTLARYPEIPWNTIDGGPGSYMMSREKYDGLVMAFEDSRIAHQMRVNALKAQVGPAATFEELAAIVW